MLLTAISGDQDPHLLLVGPVRRGNFEALLQVLHDSQSLVKVQHAIRIGIILCEIRLTQGRHQVRCAQQRLGITRRQAPLDGRLFLNLLGRCLRQGRRRNGLRHRWRAQLLRGQRLRGQRALALRRLQGLRRRRPRGARGGQPLHGLRRVEEDVLSRVAQHVVRRCDGPQRLLRLRTRLTRHNLGFSLLGLVPVDGLCLRKGSELLAFPLPPLLQRILILLL
mmetsp:Transcript_64788/g.210078  ORF Transcript_64788/g.210078 Transcript_64788/m.210078 type:complete len:222 (+) Transcript_64788:128-793(+)